MAPIILRFTRISDDAPIQKRLSMSSPRPFWSSGDASTPSLLATLPGCGSTELHVKLLRTSDDPNVARGPSANASPDKTQHWHRIPRPLSCGTPRHSMYSTGWTAYAKTTESYSHSLYGRTSPTQRSQQFSNVRHIPLINAWCGPGNVSNASFVAYQASITEQTRSTQAQQKERHENPR